MMKYSLTLGFIFFTLLLYYCDSRVNDSKDDENSENEEE